MQPITQVLLTVDKPLQDEMVTDSGLKLYLDPSYRKEWCASVIATISALPIKVDPKYKHIFDQLEVGDKVAISYQVVADFEFKSDSLQYMKVTEDNDMYREFTNSKGYWVKVYALPGKITPLWVGIHQDERTNLIDGIQGTQSQVETWLSQFPIGKTDIYSFNNLFNFEGKDYWKCNLDEIFAKKVKGHWVAVGNRVLCKPVDEQVPMQSLIKEHQGHDVKIRHQDRAKAITGGKVKGVKKEEVVSFDPKYLEKYQFENIEYYLINEDYIQGKWN